MKTIALAVLLTLGSSTAFAQTPAPAAPDGAAEAKRLHSEAKEWEYIGLALVGGGVVYSVLGRTSLAQESTFCSSAFNLLSCTTYKDPNMGAVWGGVVMSGIGTVMTFIGAAKEGRAKKLAPELTIGRGGWRLQKRLVF